MGLDLPPAGEETDPRLVAAALRAVLASSASAGRVLVVLDDAHWADASSLLVLPHALHRARGAAISVLVATRPQPGADPWPGGDGRADIDLGPLTEAAVFHLVRSRLGRTLGRGDLRRIVAVSGGNPMYALELAGLGDAGGRTLSPTLEGLVAGSVRGLPTPTRRLLVAAALAHDPRLDVVGRAAGLATAGADTAAARRRRRWPRRRSRPSRAGGCGSATRCTRRPWWATPHRRTCARSMPGSRSWRPVTR